MLVAGADISRSTLISDLDRFDALGTDGLVEHFQIEKEKVRALLATDLASISAGDIDVLLQTLRENHAKTSRNDHPEVQDALRIYSNTKLLLEDILPAISHLVVSGHAYLMILLDQVIKSITEDRIFIAGRQFINDNGKSTRLTIVNFADMPIRFLKIRPWIRIIFAFMDKVSMTTSLENCYVIPCVEGKLRNQTIKPTKYGAQRTMDNENLLIGVLKLQYLASRMHPHVTQLERENSHISLISRISYAWGVAHAAANSVYNSKDAYLHALKYLNLVNVPSLIWRTLEVTNTGCLLGFEEPKSMDWLTLKGICAARKDVVQLYPGFQYQLEKYCGIDSARNDLLKAEATKGRFKGRARKEEKKKAAQAKRDAENSSNNNSSNSTKPIEKAEINDSDSDEVDQLGEEMSSLSFVDRAENWTHTQAWFTAAVVHVAEDCRVKVLYPHFFPNGNVPAKFNWNNLVTQQSSEEIKFCVKVVNKRNSIIKTDEIFKFLPDVDTTFAYLPKALKADKKALEFVLALAPGQRLNEVPKAESTLMSEGSVRFQLTILGLHRVCNRIRDAIADVPDVFHLCQSIRTLRNTLAHPRDFTESQIELLKVELKEWI